MGKDLFSKKNHFSIRKLSVGVCSVIIGLSFLNGQTVLADQGSSTPSEEPREGLVPGETEAQPLNGKESPAPATSESNGVQESPNIMMSPGQNQESEVEAYGPLPSEAQLNYHKEELAAFIHFGMNTFTGSEWGNGKENPSSFNPTDLDAEQWIKTLKDTGFKRTIMVVKHHDGFTLYPSEHTTHDVASSPWKNGQGDVLLEVSEAATKHDMNLGVYLSPWDANHPKYKVETEAEYNEYYLNQLKEILGNDKYGNKGKFVEVWMDGARGSGAEAVTYDFDSWFNYIRQAEGDITIFSSEPTNVRWIGNERGIAGDPVWHKVKRDQFRDASHTYLNSGDPEGDMYSVGEADVSIRPGWFYHENQQPKSLKELMSIYFQSVGRGTPLLLNIPPDRRGKFADSDVNRLKEFHATLEAMYATNLAQGATVVATSTRANSLYNASHLVDGNDDTTWVPAGDSRTGEFIVNLGQAREFDVIELKEYIQKGQRISDFAVDVDINGQWVPYVNGKTVGYRRLLQGQPVTASRLRVRIMDAQATPILSNFAVYKTPKSIEQSDGFPLGTTYVSHLDANRHNSQWYEENEGIRGKSMWTNRQGAQVEFQFTGSKAYIVSTIDPNHGEMEVYIDGQKVADVNTQSPTRKRSQLVYTTNDLTHGNHTLKLVNKTGRAIATEGIYILNNEGKGMFEMAVDNLRVPKGQEAVVTIRRTGGSQGEATVKVITEPGTGVHGKVYNDKTEVVRFADGETEKTVRISTIAFTEQPDQNFDFSVKLNETSQGSLLGFKTATTVTVLGNQVILNRPNVNHLQGVTAEANDVEASQFAADKAVDGAAATRWATNQNVATPTLTLTLPQTTHIERVEIDWDPRANSSRQITADPNVKSWRLSYASDTQPDTWTVVHTRTGEPTLTERVNLPQGIDAKRLKLEVTDYVAGQLSWRNVGINEIRAFSNRLVNEPNVNHVTGSTATASTFEANTDFTGDKAIDGQDGTRWATDRNPQNPSLTVTLPNDTHIERVEIDWDKRANSRLNITADPNVRAWRLSYATSDPANATEATRQWQVAYERPSGAPRAEEVINLSAPVTAKYLKLEVLESVAGQLDWNNVGIREFRAYSNPSTQAQPTNLNQIESLSLNADKTQLVLPPTVAGVEVIGSDKTGIIDLTGRVYQPLTAQTVKVMLKQTQGTTAVTKEFEVAVPGRYADEGVGTKPAVVPVVQQWHGVDGKTSITVNTVIVADDANFAKAAGLYREDLAARGLELSLGNSTAAQRIAFKKVSDKGYGQEGYGITIDNGVITIEADSHTGAFYATRTLLQMGETDLQNGEIRDFPSFSHRGFLLDTGRKFVPYDVVIDIMKNMAYYKMNDLQLHLNDNYIFLKEHIKGKNLTPEQELEYVLNNATTGFRAEIDVVGENGVRLTSEDHYTKDQLRELVRLAGDLGINLVPEIDTPGHAMSFVKVRPDLMYKGAELHRGKHNVERAAMLDLGEKYDETLAFVKSVYEKLYFTEDAPLKDVTTVHIGTDEYYGDGAHYRRYLADMLQYIKDKGKTPRFWGSLNFMSGTQAIDGRGTELQVWNVGWHRPELALSMGAKVINITDQPTYSVPSGNGSVGGYGDYAGYVTQYDRWTPNDFRTGGGALFEASNPQIIGGGHAVWNDNIDLHETGITSYDVFQRFFASMTVTAEKTWGSPRLARTYAERQKLPEARLYAPNTNPEYRSAIDNITIDKDSLANLRSEGVTAGANGLTFANHQAYLATGLEAAGPGTVLTLDVTLYGEGPQGILTDGRNGILLSDEDGKLGYVFEHVKVQFDKTLESGRRYKVTFVTKELKTDVYVDDVKVARLPQPNHPRFAHTTFVLPLEYVTGFKGTLHSLTVSQDDYVSPFVVGASEIETLTASSQDDDHGGTIDKAFDGNPATIWHSHWTNKTATYTVDVNLKEATALQSLTYTPRQSGTNGNILRYEIYATVDGALTKISEGQWDNTASDKQAIFVTPVTTTHVQIKVLSGAGGFASAGEFILNKVPPVREEKRQREVFDDIEFGTENRTDPNLEKGQTREEPGQKGRKRLVYEDTYVNGELVTEGTEPILEEVVTQPQPKIIYTGTKETDQNPTDPMTPTDPTAPVDPTDSTDPTSPADPTVPTRPVDPTDSIDPTSPVDPTDSTDPTTPVDPTDSTDPTSPVDPTDSTDPTSPVDPTDPTDPTTPVDPTDSTDPTSPVDSTDPTDPTAPTRPVDPSDSTDPTTPADPTDSTDPTSPTDPVKPAEPTTPSTVTPARVLEDKATGIRVLLAEGEDANIVALRIAAKETGHVATPSVLKDVDYDLFDIELVDKHGKIIKMAGRAEVSLPVDAGKEVAAVVYLPNSDKADSLPFRTAEVTTASGQTQKVVIFTAEHFSEYGIVYKPATVVSAPGSSTGVTTGQPIAPAPAATSPASSVSAASKPTLPNTGEASSSLAILGGAALVAALGLVGVRKRED